MGHVPCRLFEEPKVGGEGGFLRHLAATKEPVGLWEEAASLNPP